MRNLLVIIALALTCAGCANACDGDNAQQCGFACERAHSAMLKYNHTEGCVCR